MHKELELGVTTKAEGQTEKRLLALQIEEKGPPAKGSGSFGRLGQGRKQILPQSLQKEHSPVDPDPVLTSRTVR